MDYTEEQLRGLKQIIVLRKDLRMRAGKQVAQGGHASMSFITDGMDDWDLCEESPARYVCRGSYTEEQFMWIKECFRKITVYVNSLEEFDDLYEKASTAGLTVHKILDSGETEFRGIPTWTGMAIGPHWKERFEGITDNLPLL